MYYSIIEFLLRRSVFIQLEMSSNFLQQVNINTIKYRLLQTNRKHLFLIYQFYSFNFSSKTLVKGTKHNYYPN
jgi:hypothetical protein